MCSPEQVKCVRNIKDVDHLFDISLAKRSPRDRNSVYKQQIQLNWLNDFNRFLFVFINIIFLGYYIVIILSSLI